MSEIVPAPIAGALHRLGLAASGERPAGTPLTGGVSSDVWRVELADGPVCAKRALPKLKVAGDWWVPTARAAWEARWLELAARVLPGACGVRGFDTEAGVLVLDWLDPAAHRVWKQRLLAGDVEPDVAKGVGHRVATMHATTAVTDLDAWEPARPLFAAIRIEPYLRATGRVHPDLRPVLDDLADGLGTAAVTVIHGDVSPKNIMTGPAGPVLLDAECASPGDPAFDVAFCLNHLLLKTVHLPAHRSALTASAHSLWTAYASGVTWEPVRDVERRAARLQPALALARVDGLSPVEYLTEDHGRPTVRRAARALLASPPTTIAELVTRWLAATEEHR